jgi:hypothetical protein
MDLTVLTYVVYLVISIALTIWVAMTLSKAGRVFLTDVFHGDDKLAEAVNHLLVVGFYLVNLGFVALWLKSGTTVADAQGVFTELSVKLGTVLLVLGGLHLGNVYILNRMRRRALYDASPKPPVRPSRMVAPAMPAQPGGPGTWAV